ncbi:hypothetical protein BKA24_001771 [Microbacterium marinum]|uniref:Uncharacterized protein n=1 Tax=Microbacterium marinum TaxID=421115 RepID=A0A7W7BQN6_9MICO|nr:hypothetical protein [Microbacterium marinum]MBB4667062.1 hypothetical protein [Microbacterium marinum]
MGMHYNLSFNDAIIPKENFPGLIGWTAEQVAADPDVAQKLAIDAVLNATSDNGNEPEITDEGGLDISGMGYWDSASYGFGESVRHVLAHCKPGAYTHNHDEEESTGEWREIVQEDGTILEVYPTVIWPDEVGDLAQLIADARTALSFEAVSPAAVDALAGTLAALVNALDPQEAQA